ncbi:MULTISPECIES: 4-hydroxy-tetrahydrodipicolinate reductase [Exiguobacterium]|uniref:4-hydroxy-tetrahydrodipicolinate reductase n=1 Tax=Exiguobacterium TaxID=33986 RepID=UPI0004945152|nr:MULTISPECIES: 4-hydroxy-tetrahydrodipicolinate reductase [Exiguobacterium]HCD59437.1 4-hydroxy-tetrahydrodipicolinate reductase [Exiguobacterium sp.]
MKLALHGYGATGQYVVELAPQSVMAIVDRTKSSDTIASYAELTEMSETVDAIIDFSHPSLLPDLLAYGLATKTPLVIATTGFSEAELASIKDAAKEIPIFQSYNMSYGIAMVQQLLKTLVPLAGAYDIELLEKHHNQKVDAPSGTAELLLQTIQTARDVTPVYDRSQTRQKRETNEIGMHAMRGGTIFGEHEVLFAGVDELIEIKHTALSKKVFASGAIKAAEALIQKTAGLYTLETLYTQEDSHVTH